MPTTNYSFAVPTVGGSVNVWGADLNANWNKVDGLLSGTYLDSFGAVVPLSGLTIRSANIDASPIGVTTPDTGRFTSLTSDSLTVSGNVTITGDVTATQFIGQITGDVTGNADSATQLTTPRRFSVTGPIRTDPAVNIEFDGTQDVVLPVTINYDLLWPVGSIFTTTSVSSPNILFAGTNWTPFGAGQVLIGEGVHTDSNGVTFSFTAGDAGGTYQHTLNELETPTVEHQHLTFDLSSNTSNNGDPTNDRVNAYKWSAGSEAYSMRRTSRGEGPQYADSGLSGNPINQNANVLPHNNIQPYVVVYMWRRDS
jgi:microcystin-dependent protein